MGTRNNEDDATDRRTTRQENPGATKLVTGLYGG